MATTKTKKDKTKILFVASEMDPFVKVGGLAEVIGTLTRRLSGLDCDIRVVLPYYKEVKKNLTKLNIKPKKLDKRVVFCVDWLAEGGDWL